MTIKEMQKLYKKVAKASVDLFTAHTKQLEIANDVDKIAENARIIVKAHRTLTKIGDAININNMAICYKASLGEEAFVRWCLVENIQYNDTDSIQEETEENK